MNISKAPIVALVGRANVGKSSLFNAILNRREAIIAKEPGTTRDKVTARASWDNRDFWLVDTAGLKKAQDEFELSLQDQIIEAAASADLIGVVVEADVPPTEEDRRVAKLAHKSGKPVFLLINKADRNRHAVAETWARLGIKTAFMVSAAQKTGLEELLDYVTSQLPAAQISQPDDIIRLGILGRPNVGKSSLFNTLAAKQQALVSAKSGTTRDVNRQNLRYHETTIEIADTAGIRRSGKIERGVEHFSVLRSLAVIEESDVCVLVMDAGELNVQLDQKIAGMIKDSGKGLILVVSKWDTVERDGPTQAQISVRIADNFAFAPWAPLVFTSSVSGLNVTKILELAFEIAETRKTHFKTSELNQWLGEAVRKHPPAGLKSYEPKLNYMVQENDQSLPSFKIFGAHTKFLHFSYKRYLERDFRARWPLAGTPLKFWFIDKRAVK